MWATRHYFLFSQAEPGGGNLYEISLQMEQVTQDREKREKSPNQYHLGYSAADEETEWLQSFLLLLFQSLSCHTPLQLDTVKNLCDILNPLGQLGIYKSKPGILGLGGLVSSVPGTVTMAWPHMKWKIHTSS